LGYITLLCKNEEKAQDLNNWRPISLLNTDYKIISKAICNRLKLIAHEIIGPEQTCGMSPIELSSTTLHFIRNVQDYCKLRGVTCYALSFDQAKAFDRVDHEYLMEVLKSYGLRPVLQALGQAALY
jgi:hypothetical protein